MAKAPTPPKRGFSFKGHSLSKPSAPLPGDRLDAEIDRLTTFLEELTAFLATSLEPDGTLKGSTVGERNIRTEVLERLIKKASESLDQSLSRMDARETAAQTFLARAKDLVQQATDLVTLSGQQVTASQTSAQQAILAASDATRSRSRAEVALLGTTTLATDALTAANSARIAEDMAYRWAEKLDGPVFVPNGADPVDDGFYSAKFHAHAAGAYYNDITLMHAEVRAWHAEIRDTFYPEVKALHFDFRSTYYGPYAVPPALDPFGNPPTPGDLVFDTTLGAMLVWNGTTNAWEGFQGTTVLEFIRLTDTPQSYVGAKGRVPVVSPAEDGLIWGDFLPLTGGTLSGFLTLSASPTALLHAATKGYVDGGLDALALAVSGEIAKLLPLAGGSLTGFLTLHANPTAALHAATKGYVDAAVSGFLTQTAADARYLRLLGGTLTGFLILHANPTATLHAATKGYVDTAVGTRVLKSGDTMTGALTLPGDPTAAKHAATKEWVEAQIAAIPSPGGSATHVGPTPPANPVHGQLWYRDAAPIAFLIYYVDADSSQWIEIFPGTSNAGTPAGNRITTSPTAPLNPQPGDLWVEAVV